MTVRCFKINPADNVATLLADADIGPVEVRGGGERTTSITLSSPIELGHKVALTNIAGGEAVIKFGVPIGTASQPISPGQWVHLHNCRSNFDARSGSLDLHTGATTDTKYD
ncbi:UxaA family hydrolase [Telmatospirillum sp.]|uniref:UxaA family hydrolase n=1 Tax=Telmatospirillum sp. TaxID=2079197 RepID=UPI0028507C26|nr:UxaA family hydrolase [Telmatospirillum sp.]MDR3435913.1 UxaA family hydrolase [Telmatospirillum sp.]